MCFVSSVNAFQRSWTFKKSTPCCKPPTRTCQAHELFDLILSCLFAPGLKNETEKKLFKTILKQKFDYDLTNFIEETISNLIKNQILEDRLTINKEQLQKVFFSFNYSILY